MLAAIIALALSAAPTTSGEDPRIGVAAIVVDGELVDTRRDEARARLLAASRRSAPALVDLADATASCTDDPCRIAAARTADVQWLMIGTLRIEPGERDYTVELVIKGVTRSDDVATAGGTCELCGFEDALGLLEAKATGVLASLERVRSTAGAEITIRTTPPGVTLIVDGTQLGVTPLTTRMTAGRHHVVVEKAGYLQQVLDIEAIDGVDKELELQLLAAPVAPDRRANTMIGAGAALGVLGLAVVGTGAGLLAIDGKPYRDDCQADPDGDCRFLHGTLRPGIALAVSGALVTVAGAVLIGTGVARRKRGRATERRAAITPGGVTLRF
ncbi:MAG TPA: PEGA domain-containing protein [Nannocystaceae bacterium]|nr:PEGA domain-containing protein [Nannocystaceae bacterium]